MAVKKKQFAKPGHVGPRSTGIPDVLEGPGIHNGVQIPKAEIARDAKHNPAPQKNALKDRAKATYQK
jgi:hypothetical protein